MPAHERLQPHEQPKFWQVFKGGGNGEEGIRICLPVHCLSTLPDWQPYCCTNAASHSVLKGDRIVRSNYCLVQCQRLQSAFVIVLLSGSPCACSYPLFVYPLFNSGSKMQLNLVIFPDTPRIVRSPIVHSGKALPPSSVTATMLGLLRTLSLEGISKEMIGKLTYTGHRLGSRRGLLLSSQARPFRTRGD